MAENFLKQLTKINMLNILVFAILFVWASAVLKAIFTHVDLTPTAKSTIDGLQNVMLLIIGVYLNQLKDKSKEEPKN
jgi:Na+/H+-dicarboxylate symporter